MIEWELHDEKAAVFGSSEYIHVINGGAAEYDGPYEATPTGEAQAFATNGTIMAADFVVNPIPSNYGLITWNGSTLLVS